MSDISSEYAKALFMLALEKGCSNEYKDALEIVGEAFETNPVYKDFLSTFSIPLEERLKGIEEAFKGAIPTDVLSFLKVLCENKHISEVSVCIEQYIAMHNEVSKISNARVTSALELTKEEKQTLKEKLEKKSGHNMIIEYIVDEGILGGLIVEVDGKIMDSSLKKHLKDIKDVIINERKN